MVALRFGDIREVRLLLPMVALPDRITRQPGSSASVSAAEAGAEQERDDKHDRGG